MLALRAARSTVFVLVGTPFRVAAQLRPVSAKPVAAVSVPVTWPAVPNTYSLNSFRFAASVPGGGVTPSFTRVKVGATSGAPFTNGLVVVNVKGAGPKRLAPSFPRTFLVIVRSAG